MTHTTLAGAASDEMAGGTPQFCAAASEDGAIDGALRWQAMLIASCATLQLFTAPAIGFPSAHFRPRQILHNIRRNRDAPAATKLKQRLVF